MYFILSECLRDKPTVMTDVYSPAASPVAAVTGQSLCPALGNQRFLLELPQSSYGVWECRTLSCTVITSSLRLREAGLAPSQSFLQTQLSAIESHNIKTCIIAANL